MQIIVPHGAFGASDFDSKLDSILREIAEKAKTDKGEWAEKYGTDHENDTFMMHRFCWCEQSNCPWCLECYCTGYMDRETGKWVTKVECENCKEEKENAPNFHYKPLDFKVWWYKYIGRSVETNRTLSDEELDNLYDECIKSLSK